MNSLLKRHDDSRVLVALASLALVAGGAFAHFPKASPFQSAAPALCVFAPLCEPSLSGNLTATNAAGERVFRNFFDSCGNLTNRLDGAFRATRHQYDALNRCTNTVYADGSLEVFTYDAAGNLLTAKNAVTTNTFGYSNINQLTSAVSRVAGVVFTNLYRYDLGGLATNIVYPGNKVVRYDYNADGQVTNVVDWSNRVYRITRDAAGRVTGLTYPNGISGTWDYDASHAVTEWSYSGSDTNLPGRTITRDTMGLKTREDITAGPLPTPATNRRSVNTFDAADRLTSAQVTVGTNTVTETYLYDGCGALTNISAGSVASVRALSYDLAGRLASLSVPSVTSCSFFYDALGNRVKTTINGTNHLWVIDHSDPLKRPLMESDATGNPIRYYIWGARRLLAVIDADGTTRYAHCDDQGSIVALTSTDGAVLFTANYGPYGEPWGNTGTNNTPFGWLGGHGVFHADDTSLYLTRHRAYDTTLKRFLSSDPLGLDGGANLYAYALGNPLSYIDPFGLGAESASNYGDAHHAELWAAGPSAKNYPVTTDLLYSPSSDPMSRALLHANSLIPEGAIGTSLGDQMNESTGAMLLTAPGMEIIAGEIAGAASGLFKVKSPTKLYHYTSADPAKIVSEGLVPGASKKVFTTSTGDLSPLQAQIDLALPPNRGLPQHLIEIDVPTLQKMGINIPDATLVGRNYNMPGGGMEVIFPQKVPAEAVKVIR